ncbi:NAD(P)-binding domain protein [Cordyceps fumosorosea ARSEF 2679]|uniref:NAD(P)-binding domain protein n=1 Tax=Cordyceps fumosorosea (strain ARSEF 2679) TaxID=1081104 RepID=A0A167V693_CORFA|nr:NAD(P)-binding domain protein [Cordyceps fumosorosea ARSEF 2679]OAA62271.1 NAD(P)-binding domain protein [Cordyceps fumosorosea ARSEF 2679]
MTEIVDVDYLIVGAGAMGLAFADTMLSDSKATMAIVDRYHAPGGHWTVAYPFVRLHQPSAFYGVNSKPLGSDQVDEQGPNAGLYELATSQEVLAYYSQLMQQRFLPSGRVTYHPKCEYLGDGAFRSLVTGKLYRAGAKAKIVDATYMKVTVPSMAPPKYEVAAGVELVTPNQLAGLREPHESFTVVGAGKTGIDTCLWLLASGVRQQDVTWIVPRDAWLRDREALQPGDLFGARRAATLQTLQRAALTCSSPDDYVAQMEEGGEAMRLSRDVPPEMYRCATVSRAELAELRTMQNIVRQGRVVSIRPDLVTLQRGSYVPRPGTLYVDCSTDGLAKLPPTPVFQGRTLRLQPVRPCQQVFSAAFIAHVESAYADEEGGDALKNELCRPIPHPNVPADWLVTAVLHLRARALWNAHPRTRAWLLASRLDLEASFLPADEVKREELLASASSPEKRAQAGQVLQRLYGVLDALPEKERDAAKALIGDLPKLD